jgi:hypothetical protein
LPDNSSDWTGERAATVVLNGRRVGHLVEVKTPNGVRRLRINAVS